MRWLDRLNALVRHIGLVRSSVPPVTIEHQRLCQAGILIRITQITRHAHQTSSVGVGSHRCVKATSMHGAESD